MTWVKVCGLTNHDDVAAAVGLDEEEGTVGGIWGDYVYIADSVGDLVERDGDRLTGGHRVG